MKPTPPAALSTKGRALKVMQEWEEVAGAGVEEDWEEVDKNATEMEKRGEEKEEEEDWTLVLSPLDRSD